MAIYAINYDGLGKRDTYNELIDYIQFKQTASGASTANVVYDVWYSLAKQDYIVKTNGIGPDPS